jgi:hypothetical protein
MPSISLKVTQPPSREPDDRAAHAPRPLFSGSGDTDYLCGHCQSVIAAGMAPNQHVIVDSATCAACGAVNEFPPGLRA